MCGTCLHVKEWGSASVYMLLPPPAVTAASFVMSAGRDGEVKGTSVPVAATLPLLLLSPKPTPPSFFFLPQSLLHACAVSRPFADLFLIFH